MDTYKVIFNKDNPENGLFSISKVFDPATKDLFVAMKNEDVSIQLATVNEEKRIVVGAILIPNQLIPRRDPNTGEMFNIMFDAETIKEIHIDYVKNGRQNNSNNEHDGNLVEDVTFIETWIKEDDVHDKSVLYGLKQSVGSLFGIQKIDNDDDWNGYVKTGKVKGFSIEGKFGLEKINLNSEYMNLEAIANAIKEGFAAIKLSADEPAPVTEEVAVQLAQVMMKDGVTILEAETFEAGSDVMIIGEDGTKSPAPIGEHELEDGSILVITEEGKIAEIKVMETETEEVEMSNDAKFESLIKSIVMNLSTEMATQMTALKVELKAEIAEAKDIQLSASTKAKPEVKSDKPLTNFEKFRNFNKQFN